MEKGGTITVDNPFLSCPTTSTLNVELLLPSALCCAEEEKEEVSFGTIKPTFATAKIDKYTIGTQPTITFIKERA